MRYWNKCKITAVSTLAFSLLLSVFNSEVNADAGEYDLPYALELDGDDHLDLGTLENVTFDNELTVEMWVRPFTHDDNNRPWLSLDVEEGTGMTVRQSRPHWWDGLIVGLSYEEDFATVYSSPLSTPLEQWSHFAYVARAGESPRMYINGEPQGLSSHGLSEIPDFTFREPEAWFGGKTEAGFEGMVAEVRIWNTVRTESEIQDGMRGRLTGDEEGLAGYWPLSEGSGETVHDRSGGENHGAIVGADWTQAVLEQILLVKPVEQVAPALVEVAREHPSADLRRQAVEALGKLEMTAEEVAPVLSRILEEDEDDIVRREAVKIINAFVERGKELPEALLSQDTAAAAMELLLKDEERPLSEKGEEASRLLKTLGSPGVPVLLEALEGFEGAEREHVQEAIIRILDHTGSDVEEVLTVLEKIVSESPAIHLRRHAVNTLGRLDSEGEHVGGILLDALTGCPETEVVPLGDTHLLERVEELGELEIGVSGRSRYGEAGGEVVYPLVFRNTGDEEVSVKLDSGNVRGALMDWEVTPSVLDLDPGEAGTSFVKVRINEEADRGEAEKQRLGITVDEDISRELVFKTARTTRLTSLDLGHPDSEAEYAVKAEHAPVIPASARTLGQAGRRIEPVGDEAGVIVFDVEVSPTEKNYITFRLWGSDEGTRPAQALRDGEGDDILVDFYFLRIGSSPLPGRWVYRTFVIPLEITEGRTRARLRLQRSEPVFPVYNIYTHTGPHFQVLCGEKQGAPFVWGPPREKPEDFPEIKERYAERAHFYIENAMRHGTIEAWLVRSVAYNMEWSDYYRDEDIPEGFRASMDRRAKRHAELGRDAGRMAGSGAWVYHGKVAETYVHLHDSFEEQGWLDESITLEDPEGEERVVSRREAYGDFFHDAYEWRRRDRRHYTNQIIHTSWSTYGTQAALQKLGDERALSEEDALWYVHEAVGIAPMRSSSWARASDDAGFPFRAVTPKGLSREMGYTHSYGEYARPIIERYRFTGCEKVKRRAADYTETNAYFRFPGNDAAGYRTLRNIGFIGWRGASYPGFGGTYMAYTGIHEGGALGELSPAAVRQGQLEVEHGHVYGLGPRTSQRPRDGDHPLGAVRAYEYYRNLANMPSTEFRLPMEPEQKEDFVFADEQVGTLAFRHGNTRVYGNFYLGQAPREAAIWDYGRLRYARPHNDRLINVKYESYFPGSGNFVEVTHPHPRRSIANRKDVGHPWGTRKYEQPELPEGLDHWGGGRGDRRAGLAYFYRLHYGDYLIGMNTTQIGTYRERSYVLQMPEGHKTAVDVDTGETVDLSEPVRVEPESTKVLYLGEEAH